MNKAEPHILWITNNWLFDYGGRKIASKKIVNFLISNGFAITFLDFEIKEKQIKNTNKFIGLNKKVSFYPIYLPGNKKIIFENIRFAKGSSFDCVIISGSAAVDLLTIASVRLFHLYPTAKIVLFEHTNPLKGIRLSNFWFIHILLAKIFYKTLDFIITPGKTLKDMFVHEFNVDASKIHVIHHPIISSKVFSLVKEKVIERVFNQNKLKIICTSARLDLRQKDFSTLLKSFKIANKTVDSMLVILGVGPDQKKIESLAENIKIKDRVLFLGFKENPFKYIAKSDVFVLSSTFEGAPLVLIEAMACRVPIVSTDCDFGPREILENGKNGILVSPGDEFKMAEAIIALLKNRNLRKKLLLNSAIKIKDYLAIDSLKSWYNFLLLSKP